ncbi:M18 family aminopeptidase [Sulfurimonas sp. HSL3-7]|uniref:M18 family aminopeptidase n=1 Tax=Sulfonitrofixus jiaomeiensis TaxID=3131938 RepID=UPI0031F8ED4A
MMTTDEFNEGLLGFLDASPTPFHTTRNMAMMCENAGFIKLEETEKWALVKGQKYYVTRNDSSIIAFTYPGDDDYVMMGAHTDSPNLKLKPSPVIEKNGLVQLGVEPYGGLLMNPWFDRDLSIAGRVAYKDTTGRIKEALVNMQKAIAIIPSLAIHLDDKANKERTVNAQTDIVPIITSGAFDFSEWIKAALKHEGYDDFASLLSHELSLYDTQKAAFVGLQDDFIASARLDNLLSCYVSLLTICSVHPSRPYLMVCSDHEEVGSESTSGAAGSFLESVLRRMTADFESYTRLTRKSVMISCDNAHAVHPNYAGKHDDNHAPRINNGVVVKVNANQRYASNSRTISRVSLAAESQDIKLQEFVTRSDMGCGSTIGPITATRLGIDTIDVGLPTFAMHSIRELAGNKDAHQLYRILLALQQ